MPVKDVFQLSSKDNLTKLDMSVQLFMGLIIVGCVIKFGTLFIQDNPNNNGIGRATASIWGYSIIILSFLGIIILKLQDTDYGFLKSVEKIQYYQYILIGIIIFLIYLNTTYLKQINKGDISDKYLQWDTWNTIFILCISLLMIFNYVNNKFSNGNSSKPQNDVIINKLIYFILFISFIISIIQYIILQNFTVDA